MKDSVVKDKTSWWEKIRKNELNTALEIFQEQKNLEILEIGGRDDFKQI